MKNEDNAVEYMRNLVVLAEKLTKMLERNPVILTDSDRVLIAYVTGFLSSAKYHVKQGGEK